MKKSIIAAGAASVALAAMPIVGAFAVDPTDSVTDTITVGVNSSCTFTTKGGASDTGTTYAFTGSNGQAATATSNTHAFNVFCNTNSGYKVNASASALSDAATTPTITATFAYVGGDAPTLSGANGQWHAQFTSSDVTVSQIPADATAYDIITKNAASGTNGEAFTATYSVYVGSETPAGNYSGSIAYTLTPNS